LLRIIRWLIFQFVIFILRAIIEPCLLLARRAPAQVAPRRGP
jgi:hypothetical protein